MKKKTKVIGTLAVLAAGSFFAISALHTGTSCGCGSSSRKDRIEGWATLADQMWRQSGDCPESDEVIRTSGRDPAHEKRVVILCGETSGSGHLVLIDPGADDTISTRDDTVVYR